MLLFGMIASIGIRTLAEAEIDFTQSRNLIVVSAILVLGLGGAVANLGTVQVAGAAVPLKVSGMALAALVGVVLNLLLPPGWSPEPSWRRRSGSPEATPCGPKPAWEPRQKGASFGPAEPREGERTGGP